MEFIIKKQRRSILSYDISIKAINDKRGTANRYRTSITVRNGSNRKIALEGYTVVAIESNRLYFSNASENVGFKLTKSNPKNQNSNYQICITDEKLNKYAKKYEGSYDLMFDKALNYWYIEGKAVI